MGIIHLYLLVFIDLFISIYFSQVLRTFPTWHLPRWWRWNQSQLLEFNQRNFRLHEAEIWRCFGERLLGVVERFPRGKNLNSGRKSWRSFLNWIKNLVQEFLPTSSLKSDLMSILSLSIIIHFSRNHQRKSSKQTETKNFLSFYGAVTWRRKNIWPGNQASYYHTLDK